MVLTSSSSSRRLLPSLSLINTLSATLHSPILLLYISPLTKKFLTTHNSIPSSHSNLLNPFAVVAETLKPLKAQLTVHGLGLFEPEGIIGKFFRQCFFHLGAPQLALSTFQTIESPSLYLQNLVIRCLCDHFWYEDVLALYKRCRILGCPSDNYTYPFAIKACSALGEIRIGKEIHSIAIRKGFGDNVVVQTALVDFYLKIGEFGSARVLHDGITQPDMVSWNALISGYSFHGLNQEALGVFVEIIVKGVKPNVSTLATIIPVCSRSGNFAIGKSLHGFLVKCGFLMNEYLIPALILMYASDGDLSVARDIFDCIPKKNVIVWNAMISANTLGRQSYDAIKLFQQMLQDGKQPNMVTFVSIIPSCEKIASIEFGESVHACVVKLGLENQLAVSTVLLSMYAKLGDLESTEFLFYQIPQRSLLSWNSMVSGYVHNGHWARSLVVFSEMQAAGTNPDAISIISILSSCSKLKAILLGESAHSYSLKKGFDSNINVCNALLAFYADCGKLRSSFNLFHGMVSKDLISWNTLIAGCVHNREDTNAVLYLQRMQKEGIVLDLVTLISILPCYNKPENLVQGMAIHCYTIKSGLSDGSLDNALISMYMNCGELDAGKSVFDSMPNRSVVSWNALMTGYRCQGLQNEVIVLFREMMIMGKQKPNYVTLLHVLPVCTVHAQGKSIHAYAARTGCLQATPFLTSLILMYGRFDNLSSCNLLFQMGERSNISVWNSVIAAHIQSNNAKIAMYFFSNLLQWEMEPDYVTILSLASGCIQLNDMNVTNSVMAFIIQKGFDKDVAVSNAFIDVYAKSGNMSFARDLFESLVHKDSISWSVMINGYGLNGDGKAALDLLREMKLLGLKPDKATYVSVLSACSHTGLVEQGWMAFNSMLEQGIIPEMEHYACIVDLLGRTGNLSEAYAVVETMQQRAPVNLLESLLGSCLAHDRLELGEEIGKLVMEMEPANSGSYVILHNIYAAAGKWSDANRVRSYMERRHLTKLPGFSLVEGNIT